MTDLLPHTDVLLLLLLFAAKVGLLLLIGVSWLVGWLRQPDPEHRFYMLLMALGRVSAITFKDSPGSSKWPGGPHPPDNVPTPSPLASTGQTPVTRPPEPSTRSPPTFPPAAAVFLAMTLAASVAGCSYLMAQETGKAVLAADKAATGLARSLSDSDLPRQQRIVDTAYRSGDLAGATATIDRYRGDRARLVVRLADVSTLAALGQAMVANPSAPAASLAGQCGQLLAEHPGLRITCPVTMLDFVGVLAGAVQAARLSFAAFDEAYPLPLLVAASAPVPPAPGAPAPQGTSAPVPPAPGAPAPQGTSAPVPPAPGAPAPQGTSAPVPPAPGAPAPQGTSAPVPPAPGAPGSACRLWPRAGSLGGAAEVVAYGIS